MSPVRLLWRALDAAADHTVEMGLDNVRVDADRFVCPAATDANAPAELTSLQASRSGASDLSLTWSPPVPDASHGPAGWYRVWSSGSPSGGWTQLDTTTSTSR